MVIIKGMEMPNACTSTQETLGDIGVANCPLYNVCKHRDVYNENYKPSDCPLVEVVTCKACRHWIKDNHIPYCSISGCETDKDSYCSSGERKA